ncbi:hypothetical protein GCM10022198_08930 [Klugiella xanthotipulae]|uniref:Regulatory LuxR family protein n=1 Tax=Klugiella xanthotipulae TaxID=244735 RepID=A0A543I6B1_9MICO|nr:helix-turn-helix transcriptional regulator [Klugiella xanthotipulae]TQM66020.1 regulatory LuxR family protein [Klugiella xanthotipulae]
MIGREPSLAMVMAMVDAGSSVDIVGSRGSGRSAFLSELRTRLERAGWTVILVRGVASLKSHPLLALQIAEVEGPPEERLPATIHQMVEALTQKIQSQRTVLLLDDWDDLDEASWGVAEAIRHRQGLPIVRSRLQGLHARHTPSGLGASTLESSYVVEISPITFEELQQVLEERLGGAIDTATSSRVYAKSGGVVGLAVNLVDAAVREGCIRFQNGSWIATRGLWSSSLRGVIEAYLEPLGSEARDALEIIALIGVSDTETVRQLVDWGILERLEERGMIHLYASGTRQLVSVVPPVLVDFFRHESLAVRRIRLTEYIIDKLGLCDSAEAVLQSGAPASGTAVGADAAFVWLVQENARTRRLVTHTEWVRSPTPATAVPYLKALLTLNPSDDQIDYVLDHTIDDGSDQQARTEFGILRARWRGYVRGDVDGALAELSALAHEHPFGRVADAAAVTLETDLRGVPQDFAERLDVTDDLSEPIRVSLWEAQMNVLLIHGRFADARQVFENIRESDTGAASLLPNVLFGLVLLGEGDHASALAWAQRGFEEAHGSLDAEGARAHGYVACLCLVIQGAYTKAEKILETLFALGDPPPFSRSNQLALLNIASIIAVRRGRGALSERFASELAALPALDGPLPAQSRALSTSQLLVFHDNTTQAASTLWEASNLLWDQGARFSAVMGLLTSLEVRTTAPQVSIALARAAEVGGEFLLAHAAYIHAVAAADASALLAVIPRLLFTGRPGLALSAYTLAEELLTAQGDPAAAAAAAAARQTLVDTHGDDSYDTTRFISRAVTLTEREIEILRVLADDLSNRQIAERLTLSIRTVESHLHRISRKVGAKNRGELKEMIAKNTLELSNQTGPAEIITHFITPHTNWAA